MIRRQNRMKTSPGAAAMEILRKQGRNGDTELAHVNPREKALLKALGGAGSRNPSTGMKEYFPVARAGNAGMDRIRGRTTSLSCGTSVSFGMRCCGTLRRGSLLASRSLTRTSA